LRLDPNPASLVDTEWIIDGCDGLQSSRLACRLVVHC